MNSHSDMWALVLIVAIVIGGSLIAARALLANARKRSAPLTPAEQGRRCSSDFDTNEGVRAYLTDAFESGGEARFRQACHTVALAQGCTDEQVQIQLFELLLNNKRGNSAGKCEPRDGSSRSVTMRASR